jgi:LacI family transcriptional regulator
MIKRIISRVKRSQAIGGRVSRRATIKDIAAEAQTSTTSVSLTLNNRPNRLSAETKARILDIARRLHYVPNQSARSLVSNRSMLLGLIVPDIQNVYFANLAKHLSDVCNAHGYILVIANSNDSAISERQLLKEFRSRGLDGVMIVPSLESFDAPTDFRSNVEQLDIPVIILDRISALPWCDGVGFDNYRGGELAAQCLLDHGHHHVGVIAAQSTYMKNDGRITGFLDRMSQAGFEVPETLITEGKFRYQGGFEAVSGLLDHHVTAVFCGNDLTALGALSNLRAQGLRVPQDISLIGYDNDTAFGAMGVELTTIDQDLERLSAVAIDTLTARLKLLAKATKQVGADTGKPWFTGPQRTMLTPKLVERATVAWAGSSMPKA